MVMLLLYLVQKSSSSVKSTTASAHIKPNREQHGALSYYKSRTTYNSSTLYIYLYCRWVENYKKQWISSLEYYMIAASCASGYFGLWWACSSHGMRTQNEFYCSCWYVHRVRFKCTPTHCAESVNLRRLCICDYGSVWCVRTCVYGMVWIGSTGMEAEGFCWRYIPVYFRSIPCMAPREYIFV